MVICASTQRNQSRCRAINLPSFHLFVVFFLLQYLERLVYIHFFFIFRLGSVPIQFYNLISVQYPKPKTNIILYQISSKNSNINYMIKISPFCTRASAQYELVIGFYTPAQQVAILLLLTNIICLSNIT